MTPEDTDLILKNFDSEIDLLVEVVGTCDLDLFYKVELVLLTYFGS